MPAICPAIASIVEIFDSSLADLNASLTATHLNQVTAPRSKNMMPKGLMSSPVPRASPQYAKNASSNSIVVDISLPIIVSLPLCSSALQRAACTETGHGGLG